jgi:carboxyl-terminal processing protease
MSNRMTRTILGYGTAFALGLWLGIFLQNQRKDPLASNTKMDWIRHLVNTRYVDSLPTDSLVNASIQPFLSSLDPFSSYLPPIEKQAADEVLEGNFEGIGVEFNLINDSIRVVSALPGGPSELQGILPGDRIVTVNGQEVPSTGLDNEWVLRKLRGKRGTKVLLGIYRPSRQQTLDIKVIRDKISIRSVELAWWPAPGVAHIRINKFGENTHQEFRSEFQRLRKQGPIQKLILDLRGNPGGYLESAVAMADEFLKDDLLITYTQGFRQKRQNYFTKETGLYEEGPLVVLIDAGSASASEILTGALMDHGRATIIGERSFGKALVQQQFEYPDGSAVRLTVARYYTPNGRCIQRPYGNDAENSRDTTDHDKNLGGIEPQIVVEPAYQKWSELMKSLVGSGVLYDMAMEYAESASAQRLKEGGQTGFKKADLWKDREEAALFQKSKGLGLSIANLNSNEKSQIHAMFKAMVARVIFGNAMYQQLMASNDPVVWRAVQ